jgi:tetratricopeptide (TPR) repeat protein
MGALLAAVSAEARASDERVPLAIDLSANDQGEVTLSPGTPITFGVLLENVVAAEAKGQAEARAQAKVALDALVAAGRLTQKDADEQLAGLEVAPPADPIALTAVAERFSWKVEGGGTVPFAPKMLPAGPKVVLDGEKDLTLTFTLSPEQTAGLSPGEYRVRLRYDGKGAPAGEWSGIADSDAIVLTVAPSPAQPTAEQTWERQYAFSQFHLAMGEPAKAAVAADAMLAAKPGSIVGLVQRGRAREALGDLAGALEAFRAALAARRKLDPRSAYQTQPLAQTVRRLEEALKPR